MAKPDALRDLNGHAIEVGQVRLRLDHGGENPQLRDARSTRVGDYLIHVLEYVRTVNCFRVELDDLAEELWSAEVVVGTWLLGSTDANDETLRKVSGGPPPLYRFAEPEPIGGFPGPARAIFSALFGGLEWTAFDVCRQAAADIRRVIKGRPRAQLDDQISKICGSMQIPAAALLDPLDDPRKRAAYYGIAPEAEHAPPARRCCSMCKGSGGDERGNCAACRGVGSLTAAEAEMLKAFLAGGSLDSPEVAEALRMSQVIKDQVDAAGRTWIGPRRAGKSEAMLAAAAYEESQGRKVTFWPSR